MCLLLVIFVVKQHRGHLSYSWVPEEWGTPSHQTEGHSKRFRMAIKNILLLVFHQIDAQKDRLVQVLPSDPIGSKGTVFIPMCHNKPQMF